VESVVDYAVGFVVAYNMARDELTDLHAALSLQAAHSVDRAELNAENERLRGMLAFERAEPRLTLEPAEVIGRYKGALIIDRGARHGITPAMCAMSPDGIVGVVTEVQPYTAYVYTLHHSECKVWAMAARTRVRGAVHGSGSEFSHVCTLQYIDLKDDVRPGDTVVTGGGAVFPSGFPIGTITDVQDTGALMKTAYVRPAVDPYRIDEVFIVVRAQASRAELTGEGVEAESAALVLPELQTIQERFAP
jgi:rod shape-determining protein MreC